MREFLAIHSFKTFLWQKNYILETVIIFLGVRLNLYTLSPLLFLNFRADFEILTGIE